MAKMIIGVFSETEEAENAISELEKKDYNPKDISIIMKERDGGKKLAKKSGADIGSKTISDATTGGIIGALAGMLVAAGVVPGIGALFVGGPLVAALGLGGAAASTVSGAATGLLAGGVVGVLRGLGIAGKDAADYEKSVKEGGILVAVPALYGAEGEVLDILDKHGADKIRSVDYGESDFEHHFAV